MSMTEEEFQTLYWSKLEAAIHLIVQQKPGEFIPISYEETYSAVYKCVCQQYSEKLYDKLMDAVSNILEKINFNLECQSPVLYLERFSFIMSQYFQSVNGISAIFTYLNRFYVKPKRKSELKSELLEMFSSLIAENTKLFEVLSQTANEPFAVDPSLLMSIVKGLYTLRTDFADRSPELFARFIPNVALRFCTLDDQICQARTLQAVLSDNDHFSREYNLKKRGADCLDDNMEGVARKM